MTEEEIVNSEIEIEDYNKEREKEALAKFNKGPQRRARHHRYRTAGAGVA